MDILADIWPGIPAAKISAVYKYDLINKIYIFKNQNITKIL